MQNDPQPHPAPPASDIIVKIDPYEDLHGRRIFDRVVVHGTPPENYARFVGQAEAEFNIPGAPGPIRQAYQFPIPADTVSRAFTLFDAIARSEAGVIRDRIIRDMRAVRAATPHETRLLDSSGAPIPR